jgi:GNAT superfamily N-acetyltransferase
MDELANDGKAVIRPISPEDWPRVEPLWLSLYEHQRAHGMVVELAPGAYQLWAASIQPLVGRFGFVLVAEKANALVGFFAGRLRSLPLQFGGHQSGAFTELFVVESERQQGIGDELFSAGVNWFRERDIHHIAFPVLTKNTYAREFYLRRGWVEELVQMVWQEKSADRKTSE